MKKYLQITIPGKNNKNRNLNTILQRIGILWLLIILSFTGKAQTDEFSVSKTISKTVVCSNQEVKVEMSGIPVSRPVEAILVIDRSGSMSDDYYYTKDPIDYAKDAALEFAYKVLVEDKVEGNKVGIVSYSFNATLDVGLTSDYNSVVNAINTIYSDGFTNIADGFLVASNELNENGSHDCRTIRSIILLTDGVSNRSPLEECTGNAMSVTYQTGVNYASNALGAADGNGAQLYDQDDRIVLDLTGGNILESGITLSMTWRRAANTSSNPSVKIETSTDNYNWTYINSYTVSSLSYITQNITVNNNVRYVRITDMNAYNLDLDAVLYSAYCPTCSYCETNPTSHTCCTNRAILEGQNAQSYNGYETNVFTIGLFDDISGGVESIARSTMQQAQNSGFYETESAADLSGIFNNILGQLIWAAKDITVTETVPSGFSILPSSLTTSKGSASVNGQNITWNVEYIYNETADLSYEITANEGTCGTLDLTIPSEVDYTDSDCYNETFNITETSNTCIPCIDIASVIVEQEDDCSCDVNFGAEVNLTGGCTGSISSYRWNFYLNGSQVGTSDQASGTFTLPAEYCPLTSDYSFTGELTVNYTEDGTESCDISATAEGNTTLHYCPTEPPANNWFYDCGENVVVEVVGTGTNGNTNTTLNFSNTSTIDSIYVEAVNKGGTAPATMVFSSSLQTAVADRNAVTNGDYSHGIYRAKFNPVSSITLTTPTPSTTFSFVAYVFRSNQEKIATSGEYQGVYLYHNTSNLNVPVTLGSKDIEITIPVTELNDDSRVMKVTATAGSISETATIQAPNLGTSLNITPITLHNVPGIEDQVTLSITSPSDNGDSFLFGTVVANIECIDPVVIDCPDPIAIDGCDVSEITGTLAYSETTVTISQADFENESGLFINEGCGIEKVTYYDSQSGTNPIVVTRTFTAYDYCGQTDECSTTITLEDNTPPTASNPDPINLGCIDEIPAPDISVVTDEADNCGVTEVTFISDSDNGNSCPKIITRTYRITDAANNYIDVQQTITIDDVTPPTASNPAPLSIECITDLPAPDITVVTDEADNCGVPQVAFVSDQSDGNSCPEIITRTYSVTDSCNNSITVEQTITIEDNTPPTASNPEPLSIDCITDLPVPDITVVTDEADNCGVPQVAFVSDQSDGNSCPEIITRTYSVTDSCNNSITVEQTITIEDNTPPTASNPEPLKIECTTEVPAPDIDVVTDEADNCGIPEVTYIDDVSDGNIYPETITRTYRVTDSCGNYTDVKQTISIYSDIKISKQPKSTEICLGENVTLDVVVTGGSGNYTYQWQFSDDDGNSAPWENVVSGGTSSSYSPVISSAGNFYYRVLVNDNSSSCNDISTSAHVQVNDLPQIIAQPTNKDACVGDGILLGVEATGGSGSYTYQWMEADAENGTFENIAGATESTYSPSADTDYTKYFKVVVKNSDNGCQVTSNVARVTVSPLPVANKTTLFVCDMSDDVIGYEPFYLTDAIDDITGGATGVTVSFHLTYPDAENNVNPLSSPFTNQNVWVSYIFARVEDDATGCFNIATVDLYVYKLPDAFDAEVIMCDPENDGVETFDLAGAAPLVIGTQEGVSATFFENLQDAQDSINPLGNTYTNSSATPQVIYARATITATGCYRVSQLTLNLHPQIEITAQPQDAQICVGGAATLSVAANGGSGNYSYQWMEADSENGTYTNIEGATNSSFSAPTSTAGLKFYKVEVSDNNEGCAGITSSAAMVTVNSDPSITAQPQDAEVCLDGNASLSVTVNGGSGNYSYQWMTADTEDGIYININGATSSSYSVPTSSEGLKFYTVTVSDKMEGCNNITSNVASVTVTSDPIITSQPQGAEVCLNGDATLNVTASGGTGSFSYQWQSATSETGSFANISGEVASSLSAPTDVAGTVFYRVVVSNNGNGCNDVTSDIARVLVIDVDAGEISGTQAICSGDSPTELLNVSEATPSGEVSYQWMASTDEVNYENINGANSASFQPGALTQDTWFIRVAKSNLNSGCSAESNIIAVTINKSIEGGVIAAEQTICTGGDPNAFTSVSTASGADAISYQWQSSTDGLSFEDIDGETGLTYDPSVINEDTWFQRVATREGADAGECNSAASNMLKVTVVPDPIITAQPQDAEVCLNGTATLNVTASGGTGSFSYQWQSATSETGPFANITGEVASSLSAPTNVAGTVFYRVVVSNDGNGCNNITSNVASVIVNPDLSITAQPQDVEVCTSGTATLTVTVEGGSEIYSYQWLESDSENGTYSNIDGATNSSYSAPTSIAGIKFYKVSVSDDMEGCNNVTSDIASVTIKSGIQFTAQPQDEEVCIDGLANLSVSVDGGSGNYSYQWMESESEDGTYSNINGATNSLYSAPTSASGIKFFKVLVSDELEGCNNITSSVASITVNPDPEITAQPQDAEVCAGGTATLSVSVENGSGSYSYQWMAADSENGTYENINGATHNTYEAPTSTVGIRFYKVTVSDNMEGCNNLTSSIASVTVKSGIQITAQPQNAEVCVDGSANLSVTVEGGSENYSYQWMAADSEDGTYMNISGATSNTYNAPTSAAGIKFYKVSVSDELEGCNNITSNIASVIVNPDPLITAQPQDVVVCTGGSATLSVTVQGGSENYSYQWMESNTEDGTYTNITGATNSSFNASTSTAGINFYKVVVSDNMEGCNNITSDVASVTIKSGIQFTSQPQDAEVCIDGSASLSVTVDGGSGNYTYQWMSASEEDGTYTNITGVTNSTYSAPTSSAGIKFYKVSVSDELEGCNNITSNVASVTVNPDPEITAQPQDKEVCINGTATLTVTADGGSGNYSYQWMEAGSEDGTYSNISGATNSSYPAPTSTAGIKFYKVSISDDVEGCNTAISDVAMVTVNAEPEIIAQPINKDACVGDGILLGVEASGGSGSYTYQWMEADAENGTFENITGATESTYSPSADTDYTKYFKVVVKNSDNNCSATSDVARVTVSPLPLANKATLFVCDMSDDVIGYEPFYLTDAIDDITGGATGVTVSFHLTYPDADNNVNPLSSPFTNQEVWWSMVFARVENDATGCYSIATVDLYVHKLPDAFDAELYMCDPENDGVETFDLAAAAPLVIDGQEGVSATFFETLQDAQDSINPLGNTYTNTSAAPQVIYARATITSTGCYRVSQVTLNLYPQIEITAQPQDAQVCAGGTATLSVAADGGSGNYSYQWMEADSENGTYTNIEGATNSSFSAPTSTEGLKFYKVEVADNTEGCSNIASHAALVTVNPDPSIIAHPQDAEVCLDGAATLTVTAEGGSGSYSYQWIESATENGTYKNIDGATSSSYIAPTSSAGIRFYKVTVSDEMNGCNNTTSNVAMVTVNPDPTITAQPQDAEVCVEGTATLSVTADGGSGNYSFQWMSAANENGTYSEITGATSATYMAPTSSEGTKYYKVSVSDVMNGCNTITSLVAEVIVNAEPVIITQPEDLNICVDDGGLLDVNAGGGSETFTYQWMASETENGSYTELTDETGSSLIIPTSDVLDKYYKVRVQNSDNDCFTVSNAAHVVVNPLPDANHAELEECDNSGNNSGFAQFTLTNANNDVLGDQSATEFLVSYHFTYDDAFEDINPLEDGFTNYYPGFSTIYSRVENIQTGCFKIGTVDLRVHSLPQAFDLTAYACDMDKDGYTEYTLTDIEPKVVAYVEGLLVTFHESYNDAVNDANELPSLFTNTVPVPQIIYARVEKPETGCFSISEVTLDLYPEPVIETQPEDQYICITDYDELSVTASGGSGEYTYQWYMADSQEGIFSPIGGATSKTYEPETSVAGTTFYKVVIGNEGMGCTEITSDTVQVKIIELEGGEISGEQTICANETPETLQNVTAASPADEISYQWEISFDGITFKEIEGATEETYSPLPQTDTTWFVRVAKSIYNTGCEAESNVIQININSNFSAGQIAANQELCIGGTPAELTSLSAANGEGTFSYQWQSSTNGSNFENIAGATSLNYDPGVLSTTTWFKRLAIRDNTDGGDCNTGSSNIVEITVYPDPTIESQPESEDVCIGGTPVLEVTASGGIGNLAYQWVVSDSETGPYTEIAGATGNTYNAPANSQGMRFYRVVVSNNGLDCNTVTSDIAGIYVKPDPRIVSQPSNKDICINKLLPLTVDVRGGSGEYKYQWFSSFAEKDNFKLIEGATEATYNSPTNQLGIFYYLVKITDHENGCNEITSDTIKVVVFPDPVIFGQPADLEVCAGEEANLNVRVQWGTGLYAYQWYVSDSSEGEFTLIDGATNSSYSPSTDFAGSKYYKVVVTDLQRGCSDLTSRIAEVKVNAGPVIIAQPVGGETCIGEPKLIQVEVEESSANTVYQWQVYEETSGNFIDIPEAKSNSYEIPATRTGTRYYRVAVNDLDYNCNTTYSDVVEVIVNPSPYFTSELNDAEACNDGEVTLSAMVDGGSGNYNFQWSVSDTQNGTFSPISNATNQNYLAPTTTESIKFYKVTVSDELNDCAPIESNVAMVTVHPDPFITEQPIGVEICADGEAVLSVTVEGGSGNYSYQWVSSDTKNSTYTDIQGATNSIYYIPTETAGTTWYKIRISDQVNGCNNIYSDAALVTIIPQLDIVSQPEPEIVCLGESVTLEVLVEGGTGTYSYQWMMSDSENSEFTEITGAVSNTYEFIPEVTNSKYYKVLINDVGADCNFAESNIVEVQAIKIYAGEIEGNQTICAGERPAPIINLIPKSAGLQISYQWKSSIDGINFFDIPGATGESYSPNIITSTTWFLRAAENIYTTCVDQSNVIQINVTNSLDGGEIAAAQTVCEGSIPEQLTSVSPASGDGSFTYQWQVSSDGSNFTDIEDANGLVYQPEAVSTDTWYKRIATRENSDGGNCNSSESNSIKITVNNVDGGTIAASQQLCNGSVSEELTSESAPISDGEISFQWQVSYDGMEFKDILDETSENYTPDAITAWYRRVAISTMNGVSCEAISNTVKISFIDLNGGEIEGNQVLCNSDIPNSLTNIIPATGSDSINYQWLASNDSISFTEIMGATEATYLPEILTEDKWFVRKAVGYLDGFTCSANSNVIKITVINIDAGEIAANQEICSGNIPEPFSNVIPASGNGEISYQWQSKTEGNDFEDIFGADAEIYAPGVITTETWFRRIAFSSINGESCSAISDTILISVINGIDGGEIGSDQVICLGDETQPIVSISEASGEGNLTYQWQSSANGSEFTNIVGATGSDYNPGAISEDTQFRRMVYRTGASDSECNSRSSNIVTIDINSIDEGSISGNQVICAGEIPAELTSEEPAVADGILSYQWQVSQNGVDFTDIEEATGETYQPKTVTAWYRRIAISSLDESFCSNVSNQVKITVNDIDGGNIGEDQALCNGDLSQELTSIVDATGAGEITYQWLLSTDGVNFEAIEGATDKNYLPDAINEDTWFVRNAIGILDDIVCNASSDTVKLSITQSLAVVAESNSPVCLGSEIMLSETAGQATAWHWQGPNGFTSEEQNPVIPEATVYNSGIYTVTGISGNCETTDTIEVLVSEPPVISLVSTTDVSCYNGNNGSATIAVSGDSEPYTITWNTVPEQSGETAEGLSAGTYTVMVMGTEGCTSSEEIIIDQPEELAIQIVAVNQIPCTSSGTGSVDIEISGGTEPYSVIWESNNITVTDVEDPVGLNVGIYTVTVTDANDCTTSEEVEIRESSNIEISVIRISNADCNNNLGSIMISANGGVEPYTYKWDDPLNQTTPTADGLAPGTYTIEVTDANNCIARKMVTVDSNDTIPPVASCSDAVIYLDENGQALLTVDDIEAGSYDNCGIDTMYLGQYIFDCNDVGISTVTVFVEDFNGNTDECIAQVTVNDTIKPVVECIGNVIVQADNGQCTANVEVQVPIVSDNCGIQSIVNSYNQNQNASGTYPVGTTHVVYEITDFSGNISYCEFDVTVLGAIEANADRAAVQESEDIPVLENDFACPELDTSSIVITQNPEYGTVEIIEGTGEITYTVSLEFSGLTFTDEFIYSVCNTNNQCDTAIVYITHEGFAASPLPPVAVNDTFYTDCDNVLGNVLDNDEYIGEPLTVSILTYPSHGEIIFNADGSFEYDPDEGFRGEDAFTYQICYDNYPTVCSNIGEVIYNVDCPCELFIPDAFSPNNDNVHDVFYIECLEIRYPEAKLEVYNRWGVMVYKKDHYGNESDWGNIDAWWDGRSTHNWTLGNEKVPVGTYFYILQLEPGNVKKGTVYVNY